MSGIGLLGLIPEPLLEKEDMGLTISSSSFSAITW
jgi:hypothetical protein